LRLLRIEVENLNSLYGRHAVDFEKGLGGSPLVLITGPTGAGKSTLLDAVGLALFGRTPRLTALRSDDAALDARSVLSRGTAEGSASVVFLKREGSASVRYRATWYCKRAHRRPDGALQDPVRTLERFDPAKGDFVPLASDARAARYQPQLDLALDGLSVADFQRSMLLAQGEFAAFLKADPDERVRLLERLTATERFRAIGERAAQSRAAARQAFEALERELSGIALLPDAERQALAEGVARCLEESQRLRAEAARASAALAWLGQRADHRRRLDEQAASAGRAREALAARASELARLAEHERSAAAGCALREFQRAALEAEGSRRQVARLDAEARLRSAELQRAERDAGGAQSAREAAAQRLAEAAPSIAAARALRTRLGAAEQELAASTAELRRAQADAAGHGSLLMKAREACSRAEAKLAHAERRAASLGAFRPLVARLAGFEARCEALRSGDRELSRRVERREARRRAVSEAAARLKGAQEQSARQRGAAGAAQEALQAAASALWAALGPAREVRERREVLAVELEAAAGREAALEGLADREAERGERSRTVQSLSTQLTRAEEGLRRTGEARPRLERSRREQEEGLRSIDLELDDLAFLSGMARERGRLRSGEPCPLCGSERHPHLEDGRFAELDLRTRRRSELLGARRAELSSAAQSLQRELEGVLLEAADLQARLESLRPEHERQARQLGELEARLREGLERLGLGSAAELDVGARAAAAARAQLQAAARELDQGEARWRAAQASDQQAAARLVEAAHAEAGALADLESRRRALEEDDDELSRSRGQLEAERESLAADLEAHGAGADRADLADLISSVAAARQRVDEVRTADVELEDAKQTLAAARAASAEAGARAQASAERLEAAGKAERIRASEATSLRAQVGSILSGQDPDRIEAALQGELDSAAGALLRAQSASSVAKVSLADARGRLEVESGRSTESERQAAEFQAAFQSALEALGFSEPAELEARLLDAGVEARLAALRRDLQGEVQRAADLLASRKADLEEVESRRPSELAPGAEELPLRETLRELERRVEDFERQRHGMNARLEEDAGRRAAHAEQAARCEALRRELEIWERLHALIGVRDGQQFQRFAQLLNLEELVRKASARLGRIAPRYQLVPAHDPRGEMQLAFAVRDEWHGGVERPITTLSGGESFLVSLALALALADYRAVRMPIETLLLDEGFGALDRETLGVTMGALSALTSEGVQIALISHVEWLRDQIEAQVAVEPCGNGHSRVVVTVAGRVVEQSDSTAVEAGRGRRGASSGPSARRRASEAPP
jgi:exonuclease SbcC